jgi:hypothetical protein
MARALELLPEQGRDLHIVSQNLVELWVVATRPVEQNGLGMPASSVAPELERLKSMFLLLPDTPAIYPSGKRSSPSTRLPGSPRTTRAW